MSSQFGYDPTKVAGSGETIYGTAGAAIANRDICCVAADGLYYPADADLAVWMPSFGIAMSTMATGQTGQFLVKGFIGLATWTWTPGSELYVSATAGQMSHTAGAIRQQVGVAFTATQVFIHPQGLDSETGCALLEGHTAYVGFDNCRAAAYSNYWVCDGAADDVQIALAIAYVNGLGGGSICIEEGTYIITSEIDFEDNISLFMYAAIIRLGGNVNMFDLNNKTDVKIFGGELDGVKATYNADVYSGIRGEGTRVLIKDVRIHDFEGKGIFCRLHYSTIENVWSHDHDQDGIYLEGTIGPDDPTNDVEVLNCKCWGNTRKGFNNGFIVRTNFTNCKSYSNTEDGWNIEGGTGVGLDYHWEDVKLEGCYAYSNTQTGFRLQMGGKRISLLDCQAYGNGDHGVYVRGRDDAWSIYDVRIIGGEFYENDDNGILIAYGVEHLKIVGVSTFNNDQGAAGTSGIAFNNTTNLESVLIDDVYAYDDQGVATQNRGVDFGAVDLTGKDITIRSLRGTGNTVQLFRGANANVPTLVLSFVEGTTFLSAFPIGWEIDAGTEYAAALGHLPLEVQQVLQWKIWATALVTEADAMRLEIQGRGGASNEPYTTETVAVANHPSETTNFTANDVIYWLLDPSDDTDIDDMVGGDQIMIKVLHEAAGGADAATDAVFTCIEIEYV